MGANSSKEWMVSYLQNASRQGFVIDGGKVDQVIVSLMFQHIGDPDPYLRDELIYSAFHHWICKLEYITNAQLIEILITVLDDGHLFFSIGNDKDDTVFTRTFSALVVSLIVSRNRKDPFIPKELFDRTKERLLQYYRSERDLRGYVEGKGWAHGAAHGADALDELALSAECDASAHMDILNAIRCMLLNANFVLCFKEDDRIANAVYSVYSAKLISDGGFKAWMEELSPADDTDFIWSYSIRVNLRNLIRSIYFKFMQEGCTGHVLSKLIELEKKLR